MKDEKEEFERNKINNISENNVESLEEPELVQQPEFLDDEIQEPLHRNDDSSFSRGNIAGNSSLERAHNRARGEDGRYNKNYYADKKNELANEREKLQKEKDNDQKMQKGHENENPNSVGSNTQSKNKFDKLKDNAKLANNNAKMVQNRINNAQDKLYNMTHPLANAKENIENKIEDKINEKIKDPIKNKAKDVGKKALNKGKEAGKKAGKTAIEGIKALLKSPAGPYILIVLGVILFIIILCGLLASLGDDDPQGLYGYDKFNIENLCETVSVVDHDGNPIGDYELEDYISGVVYAEAGSFNNEEIFKLFSILARTFTMNKLGNADSCTIESSSYVQNFRETSNETITNAVHETRGLVLVRDDALVESMYDAFCWDEKDGSYYYMCQKEYDTGDSLAIPYAWAENALNTYYGSTSGFLSTSRYQSHGQGVSAYGAFYQATEEGYTYEDILEFYYGSDAKIMTIYDTGVSVFGECTIYAQGNPSWGAIHLGNSNATMADSGCAVTSVAIGISCSGTEIASDEFDAGVFIRKLNSGSCFTASGGIYWGCAAISEIAPNVQFVSTMSLGGYPNSRKEAYINQNSGANRFLVVHINNDAHPRGHYVVLSKLTSDSTFEALDPAGGRVSSYSLYDLNQVVVYSF